MGNAKRKRNARRDERADEVRPNPDTQRLFGLITLALAIFLLAQCFGFSRVFNSFPLVSEGAGYAMLFVIGLLTSLHCIAMCGGINLSQTISRVETETRERPQKAARQERERQEPQRPTSYAVTLRPSLLYNLGRVISYTLVGALVGALGSVIAFDGFFKGVIQLIAGVFMVVMALILLGVFPWLRQFNITLPKALTSFVDARRERSKSPLVIGLLNGLMPCGPLQAMQLYALSTGSALVGALSMFAFSLGTVPLMFGLGALGSLLTKRFRQRATAAGAVLVAVLGFFMFSTGWNLSGFPNPLDAVGPAPISTAGQVVVQDGYQLVNNALEPGTYPNIEVQAGLPVRWNLSATEDTINGCNNRVFIPEYGIEHSLEPGDNIIEFTPTEPGRYTYTCWMGMIRGTITVTDA
ncbi:MAG: sulfite exporter TauE/SafE family protein [Coriobacteriales bacterium]|nr:sulfite exporter TauE/SafE family protein [Coriobacteriales bacterium]